MVDAARPKRHLAALAKRHPSAWRQADEFRAGRGQGLPDWPDGCHLPMAAGPSEWKGRR